jgi:HD superfamily phosphohydrolase YqeK
VFETELSFLKYDSNRKFLEYVIECIAPDQFFVIPPSASGKYHPLCTMKEGGLVIHTKRLIFFAMQLAAGHKLEPKDVDKLIIAGVIHDIGKKAKYSKTDPFPYEDHPLEAVDLLKRNEEQLIEFISRDELEEIFELIKFHMGPWTPKSILKKLTEYTELELIIYHSDYLSSRPNLVTPVDNIDITIPKSVKDPDENSGVHTS